MELPANAPAAPKPLDGCIATATGSTSDRDRDAVFGDVPLASQPTTGFAAVEEVGALAVFLCRPGGGSITSAALPAYGGWTAQ